MQNDALRSAAQLAAPDNATGPRALPTPARPTLVNPSLLLAALAVTICSLLIAITWFDPLGMRLTATELSAAALQRMGEYLFFIGTTHLSLLLLRKRKWIMAKLMFGLGVLWVAFHEPLTQFVENLGGDSFAEAQAFDVDEAVFWLETLHAAITPRFSPAYLLCYLLVAVASYQALRVLLRRQPLTARLYSHLKFSFAVVIIGVAVHHTVSKPAVLFIKNTEVYAETRRNFNNPAPVLLAGGGGMDLLVYIGESTSTMNMGIYGYPRDTTPALQKLKDSDDSLLVFRNVFSTHTHTSPSLLEAFSFGVGPEDAFLPIHKRKRLSLVDLLASNQIRPTLVSNQGQTGTWNMASSIIFSKARSIYSTDTRRVGNNDDKLPKPWDDLFFDQKIQAAFDAGAPQPQVVFFHSYAGHGGYHDNIPGAYRTLVDSAFGPVRMDGHSPGDLPFRTRIEEYDAAIRYIDRSVSRAIEYAKASPRPMAFVYFADHGDAPFAGRAHDSSQFIHEMARVPFLVYFNRPARERFPDTFEKYRMLAAAQHDATLAQLSSTLLDLLNLRVDPTARDMAAVTPVIGERTQHPPIVVRETAAGVTYVNINQQRGSGTPGRILHAIDRTDYASRAYSAVRRKTNGDSRVCYRGVDSVSELMRSRLVADCIEIAVTVHPDGRVEVPGIKGQDSGLGLRQILEVAAINRMGLWIHAPDLRTRSRCETLQRYLRAHAPLDNPVLVEFPPGSQANGAELGRCAARLGGMGVATSYFVARADAVSCAQSLAEGKPFESKRSCVRLRNDVASAWSSGLFTDIGFDYAGLRAMEAFRETGNFRWNTWQMPPEQYSGALSERFKMTILAPDTANE